LSRKSTASPSPRAVEPSSTTADPYRLASLVLPHVRHLVDR
jgi:hypothetical protein